MLYFNYSKLNCLVRLYYLILEMPKYAVAKGRQIGVYDTWDECKKQVQGFTGAKYKKFDTHQEAEEYINDTIPTKSVKSVEYESTAMTFENKYSHTAFPVTKVSPSNIALSDLNKSVNLLETKLSNFMKHVNASFDDIKKRLSALEEKKMVDDQIVRLENEDKEVKSKKGKGVKRKAPMDDEIFDLNDEDFINLNYDDDINGGGTSAQKMNTGTGSGDPLPKQKATKLSKCKIIDEIDGYYGIGQCVVSSSGYLVNPFGAVVVYTDGACTNNGRVGAKAGIGVWFNHNHPRNLSAPVRGRATNNNAEIQAATAAISQVSKDGIRYLHIYTDSQFLINCITTWIYTWKKNKWLTVQGNPVINKVELVELDNYINEYMDSVVWTYVKGHSGDMGNSCADDLARKGALLYKPE